MRTLSEVLIGAKNAVHDSEPFLILLQLEKDGWWALRYDNLQVPFSEGATLTGSTAGADILFVYPSTDTTGFLIITNARGDEKFGAGTAIQDDSGGLAAVAVELDTTADDPVIARFVRNTESITYDGYTWDMFPFTIGETSFGKEELITMDLTISNVLRMPEAWLRRAGGLSGARAKIQIIYHGDLDQDPIWEADFKVQKSSANRSVVTLSLGMDSPLYDMFPKFIYSRRRCMWRFKDTETCQYTGSDYTCDKTISDCVSKNNEAHFGGFPAIPGSYFEY